MAKEIVWFLGPRKIEMSGTGKYNLTYLRELKKYYNIKEIWFKNCCWFLYLHFILPLRYFLLLLRRDIIKVFPDESYSFLYLLPVKSSIIIFHHSQKGVENKGLKDKIFFGLIRKTEKLVKRADIIIAVSEKTKQELVERIGPMYEKKVKIIYNPFDFSKFKVKGNKEKIKKELIKKYNLNAHRKKILLYVGSEETRKNLKTLLLALKDLKNVLLIKIGKPYNLANRREHLNIIKKYNLNVKLIDFVSEEDLIKFYKISDLFVMPSLKEGFGRPIIEAQYSGLPVLCSNIDIFKEIAKDSVFYVNDPLSTQEWKTKIEKLLKDKKLREKLIKKGRINAKKFDVNVLVKRFERVFEEG